MINKLLGQINMFSYLANSSTSGWSGHSTCSELKSITAKHLS